MQIALVRKKDGTLKFVPVRGGMGDELVIQHLKHEGFLYHRKDKFIGVENIQSPPMRMTDSELRDPDFVERIQAICEAVWKLKIQADGGLVSAGISKMSRRTKKRENFLL